MQKSDGCFSVKVLAHLQRIQGWHCGFCVFLFKSECDWVFMQKMLPDLES
jgi:hypothetical protein